MSLREWARSRRVPLSTAHKGAQSGRISRDLDGLLDPARADQEWYENTRIRVDMRRPVIPATITDPRAAVKSRRKSEKPSRQLEWETVRVADALSVEAKLQDLLAAELVVALNRAVVDIAPRLARPGDRAWVAERLHGALLDGWLATEAEWRRRFPLE